jgi:hypothetical protein
MGVGYTLLGPLPTLGALFSCFTLFYLNKLSCFTLKKKKKTGDWGGVTKVAEYLPIKHETDTQFKHRHYQKEKPIQNKQ